MGEEAQGNKSNLFVENLWWIGPGFGTFFVVCGILVFGGGGGEAKVTTMNLVDDDGRGRESQSALPSDSASAEYGSVDPAVLAGLPSWIFEDSVFGYPVLCATINTPEHGYPGHYESEEPIVSTVHQILRELGDRVYPDEVLFRLGEHVEVRKVNNIGKYANGWKVCGVKK